MRLVIFSRKKTPGPKPEGLNSRKSAAGIAGIVAAAAATADVPAAAAVAAAAPDDDQQNDDPAAVAATKTVIAHMRTSCEM